MQPHVIVIEHHTTCPPALMGEWLVEAGCELDVCRPWAGDSLPDLTAVDGVLVLGGDMGAHDDDTVPWLAPLKVALRAAIEAEVPTLGVCLGHQLLAVALGGESTRNPRGQAVGLVDTGWTTDAADDPLTAGLDLPSRGVQWNSDVVTTLPPGAVVLARSAGDELQVARFAAAAWGVQAHPEVDVTVLRSWADGDRADHLARGIDQEAVLSEVDAARVELEEGWRPLTARFAALATGRAARRAGSSGEEL